MNPIRIMIVEDERIIALDLQLQLQAMGYQVCQVVATGALAIQKAQELNPDLILMDIHLEGPMDGIEAAYQIHSAQKTPIVFLTAYAEDATLKRAEAALPYGYLVKPVSPRELYATIQMAAVRRGAQKQIEEQAERLQLALEAAALDVWEWDAATNKMNIYELVNSNFSSSSFPICEPLESFYNRIDTRDLANVKTCIERAIKDGGSINLVFRTKDVTDKTCWIEVHAKRIGDTVQGDYKIIGVLQDITERRSNESRLQQAMVVFESTAEGILILDQDRRIISSNPAFSFLTGYSHEEVKHWRSVDYLYEQEHSPHFFEKLTRIDHGHWQGNVRYHKKNGHILAAWETINVVRKAGEEVVNFVLVFSDIGAVLAIQDQLEYLAKHDSLTSLYNRRMFLDHLEIEIGKSSRNQHQFAVLLIDLDHFKTINDSLGHVTGDLLLKETAARLLSCVRATDTVARLGGDEFVLILAELDTISVVDQIAKNILARLSEPYKLGESTCYVTGSIGIAIGPADGNDPSELIKNADQAMYSAKQSGRNAYGFFQPFMQKASEMRMQISTSLHEALAQQQFWVAYQPIVDLKSGVVHKAEALIRWNHPLHGAIGPASFIPIAEESGVIRQIGDWVFEQIVQQLLLWQGEFGTDLQISINVSPLQLRNQDSQLLWFEHLKRLGLTGQSLLVEITEGLLLDASPLVCKYLSDYQTNGIQIALDDFGTGYSSLSYLKKFDIDYLKIDQSFVKNLEPDSDDLALCEAIIVMAHKLGIKVIAEGIETAEQAQLLTQAGCDFGQGYYYARPVAGAEFAVLMREQRWVLSQIEQDVG